MLKVTQVYYGFVIPKNKCVKKEKLCTVRSLHVWDNTTKHAKTVCGNNKLHSPLAALGSTYKDASAFTSSPSQLVSELFSYFVLPENRNYWLHQLFTFLHPTRPPAAGTARCVTYASPHISRKCLTLHNLTYYRTSITVFETVVHNLTYYTKPQLQCFDVVPTLRIYVRERCSFSIHDYNCRAELAGIFKPSRTTYQPATKTL
jgi:hypothetical protein